MAMKINRVKKDLRSYPHYIIMGTPKVGKTTLFRDLVLENYPEHPEKGLLISFGMEDGYKALDDLNYEEAHDWDALEDDEGNRGFIQICDELIKLRGTEDQIELVGLDTLDELVEVATKQVYEEHRDITGKYPKSLNDSLGGYGKGKRRVVELIREQIERLNKAGMAIFILAHTKLKEQTDVFTGDKYDLITNNLNSDFYGPIANSAQMIVNIIMDRGVEGQQKVKKKVAKDKEIDVILPGRQTKMERMMYFRENPFVEAGGRFSGLPDKLPLSASNFMLAFNEGVKNSQRSKLSSKEEKDNVIKEEKEIAEAGQKLRKKELVEKKQILRDEIHSKLSDLDSETTKKVGKYISKVGLKSFDDETLNKTDIEVLEELLDIING